MTPVPMKHQQQLHGPGLTWSGCTARQQNPLNENCVCVCYRGTHTLENRKLLLLSSRIITSLLVQIPGVSSNNSSISLKGVKTVICYWFIQATTTGRTIKNIPTRWQQIVIKNSKRDSVLLKIFLQIL